MHLLASQPGGFVDTEGIVDLRQSAADMVILSAADSSLTALASAAESMPADFPSLRLANWMHLLKPAAFDLYREKVLDKARLVVVSLLGGKSYWEYGFEQLQHWSLKNGSLQSGSLKNRSLQNGSLKNGSVQTGAAQTAAAHSRWLILVPGDDTADPQLFNASTVAAAQAHRVWRYLRESGVENCRQLLQYLASEFLQKNYRWQEPRALPPCLVYLPAAMQKAGGGEHWRDGLAQWRAHWRRDNRRAAADKAPSVCMLLFYRSHLQSADTAMFDALIECVEEQGLSPLPVAVTSLKDTQCLSVLNALIALSRAGLILNTTGFASNSGGVENQTGPALLPAPAQYGSPFSKPLPVLQLILSGSTEEDWHTGKQGLRSRDIAMQVVLPEMDGRIITRAVSFKTENYFCRRCEIAVIRQQLHRERAGFVAALARRYSELNRKQNADKRIALILANYPTKDGRIGNGVGLDTPASAIRILQALQSAAYPVADVPAQGTALIEALLGAITNNPDSLAQLPCWQSMAVAEYMAHFQRLPPACRAAVWERWGGPDADVKFRRGRLMIAGIRLGQTFVGIQPARGFNIDIAANYHDPDLVPPHSYLVFYFWLRHSYRVDAVIHVGKHGNLEWLPGKGTALSNHCWPDIALGPMPHFYPFIVNDPGEGAQAKRRAQAVIIDHLMPPLTRAETYGELADLEALVDEYYQALGMDERRECWLREKILQRVRASHVMEELGTTADSGDDNVLLQLDAYLCDIKEAQIRHGLHILGSLPDKGKLADTLVALLRLPRGAEPEQQGILHNLGADMALCNGADPFDPLTAGQRPWRGARPALLVNLSGRGWRTEADTRERLEMLARQWVNSYVLAPGDSSALSVHYPRTAALLGFARHVLLRALEQSVDMEISSLLSGLNGQFVPPGPSGAPTRGRLDTLPTGRNFFSLDNRSIPTPAAWALGEKSARALIERHLQEQGDYPRQLGLSVWGTATMRTGGDDIAQAFALMGVKPVWAPGSRRVVDVEVLPAMLLGRPRVDVTLRVSGFFRDAFANVIKLYDTAVQAIATLQEPGDDNTIAANIQAHCRALIAEGLDAQTARRQASYRVFGSKPGAYGAGLQGLIDERCWQHAGDLARAYLNWGGYAYGQEVDGVEAKSAFQHRLSQLDTVVQNQDNREHDLLDSDDYYQFQGGMANAVNVYRGRLPAIYHSDHSNPSAPRVRTLGEELNRVIRTRVLNPKWIGAMREHGYKGAFEMAASIDYLFAFDATTGLIADYQYEKVADALVFDPVNQAFLRQHNPNALEEMGERLLEAIQRGLWLQPGDYARTLRDLLLDMDQRFEQKQEH